MEDDFRDFLEWNSRYQEDIAVDDRLQLLIKRGFFVVSKVRAAVVELINQHGYGLDSVSVSLLF
jgi:hypothetical protein